MSVINQVLLDLEKRRASAAERGVLSSHVRVLPGGGHALRWEWVAAGGIAAAAVLAGAWVLLTGFDVTHQRFPQSVAAAAGAKVASEKMVAASAAATADVGPRADSGGAAQLEALASRPSLELFNPPDPGEPLPAARIIGRAAGEPSAPSRRAATPEESPRQAARPDQTKTTTSAAVRPGAADAKPMIQKQVRQPTPRDLAENEHRKAAVLLHQGRLVEAQEGFQAALNLHPGHHGARQAMVGLLLADKKVAEAERVLEEGVKLDPAQTGLVVTLARLQVNRGDNALAIATLQNSLEHAQGSADYSAFLAALLQRQGRHEEAIERFLFALRLKPGSGVWLLGLGVSLQAVNRAAEAKEAYRHARAANNLSPQLAAFANQRLRQLQ